MFSSTNTGLIKKRIRDLLLRRDYEELNCLNEEDNRVWRLLQSNLFAADDTLRWHSIEAVAVLTRKRWELGQRERVLDYMRRLIWSISDESGGIGWSAPQTIAEIAAAIPQLQEPFVNIMIDRAFSEPALIKSGLWGIGRMGQRARQSVELFQDIILKCFESNDPETLGLAAWSLAEAQFKGALPFLQVLKERPEPVRIYIPPDFHEKPLKTWVKAAITRISQDTLSE